jgi:predicted TIM-barrel fold metal-dependent hydrolase
LLVRWRDRARLHSPLLLEDALLRHPKLRVYVMHAGWPMLDDLLAVVWVHPQDYVDVGAIVWALPRVEFHRFLQRIVEAGFGTRVMFGSDQMTWPGVIERALTVIESAPPSERATEAGHPLQQRRAISSFDRC